LDHVFLGQYEGPLHLDRDEVDETKFVDVEDLKQDVRDRPEHYTPWFKISLDRALSEKGS
jgi:isopentenyl-diphosphate delta-isomerase